MGLSLSGLWDDVKGAAGAVGHAVGGPLTSIFNGATGQTTYQATTPDINRQNFAQAIQQSQGGFNQNQADQSTLAKALLAQSQGAGPNPALDQLQQTTDQNIANSNNLIASQRGVNPALAARNMAMNAGNENQQAAQQAAVMRAQQQLAAQQQLQGLYGTQGQQQLENQNILQGANASQNSAINQGSLGVQGINAGINTTNATNEGKAIGGFLNGAGGSMSQAGAGGGSAGGASTLAAAMSAGGEVPGKASVPGDSLANDKVPAVLSPGEIVIPRSHAKDPESAKSFIDAIMASKGDDGAPGYAKVLRARKTHEERMSDLSKFLGAKK